MRLVLAARYSPRYAAARSKGDVMAKRGRRRGKRSSDSYTSTDPAKRAAQLANLRTVPPTGPGHGRPAVHGGYAAVATDRLDEKVREVFEALAVDAPLRDRDGLLPAADTVAVRMLAEALCRLEDVSAHIRAYGALDQKTGAVRPVVELEGRLRREVADWLDSLGMTPRSRAKLGLDVVRAGAAFDLAQHWAEEGGDDAR
jgi:hypothetical protein